MMVALEFVHGTNVPDARVALQVVEAAGRPNGGICIDTWWHARGANDLPLLRAAPADRVVVVQFGDGSRDPVGDQVHDTVHHRTVPGEGDFDLDDVMCALRLNGVRARSRST